MSLPAKSTLHLPDEDPAYAYFLTLGIASVVASCVEGGTVEIESIGREGLVGCMHLLGPAPVPSRCLMQLPGSALRIRMSVLREMFSTSAELRGRILEFVQVQTLTMAQIAGCHRFHTAEQRLARWLLRVQDRVLGDTLGLTQEFLAEMLGLQRTTISAGAVELQKNGIIDYARGQLRVVDRAALERVSCTCYPIMAALFQGLYRPEASSSYGIMA